MVKEEDRNRGRGKRRGLGIGGDERRRRRGRKGGRGGIVGFLGFGVWDLVFFSFKGRRWEGRGVGFGGGIFLILISHQVFLRR